MATASETATIPQGRGVKELTIRGVILGAIITVLFTAANVYLGLRAGLTFATSIPAAVISMAVLKFFRDPTIQENNIVQTIASSAGTLAAIVFVLPGLVMVGWWTGFPYWLSVAVIAIGGILGVMYSVPLRRALVTESDLPYPEGVAAAEVLKVGAGVGGAEENKRGLSAMIFGSVVGAGYPLLAKMKLVAEEATATFKLGTGATTLSTGLSLAYIGVGHLVGLAVGLAMLVGIIIGFIILLPIYTAGGPPAGVELADFVGTAFTQNVRFVGAGAIGVAAIWTLLKVIGPIARGIVGALAANRTRRSGGNESLPLTERDIPITIVGSVILLSMLPIGLLLAAFASTDPIAANPAATLIVSIIYVLIAGIVIAAVCGYMAGLIGASNSPISGVGILSVLGISLLLALLFPSADADATKALVAFALFVTAIVFGVATISNDNLQDLKTGQLVGATPWRQQLSLVLGVLFGAAVIPPVLSLLNSTFGFVGTPGAGPDALAAPQAALISAIAQGVLGGTLDWNLIGLGAVIGVAAVVADEGLRRTSKASLPPLAVGMGIYLPVGVTGLIVVGAIIGHMYERWAKRQADPGFASRMGVLGATGLIVGDSLFNVAYAAIVAGADNPDALAVTEAVGWQRPVGILLFAAIVAVLYWRTCKQAAEPLSAEAEPMLPPEANFR
ncbi:oligopeptide transporter, OPT family [Sphingomonas sinipercae]|uniref:Oligopeptide transporter, OPT family n=1 Tax=Sphingomonas sinipercae TaxID=2714944 RepID=A0A6G7ZQC7_9SPHN|nr:oligopeptide transporter, OPT family [Sphingomonas sinipercae]QIL03122.1 oligopeptide transporter, OPT family [Sphingomonas sinipercae]